MHKGARDRLAGYVFVGEWNMYKVTRDNIRTYEDKLSGNDGKLQQNPETTSWFVDKDEDDQEYTGINKAS